MKTSDSVLSVLWVGAFLRAQTRADGLEGTVYLHATGRLWAGVSSGRIDRGSIENEDEAYERARELGRVFR